jgi:hypothetical protein
MSTQGHNPTTTNATTATGVRRVSTETKASVKTTELIAYVASVITVLVAAAMVDNEGAGGFGAEKAWFYITLLTIGYMISRGLAKSGSRDYYDDQYGNDGR